MRKATLILVATLSLALAGPAWATGGHDEENAAQTARALSLQALALLEQTQEHKKATEKLDDALKAKNTGDVDLRALRDAHAALHQENVKAAREQLRHAFPDHHVVGATFRPTVGAGELGVGIAGGVVLALALVGLALRRRADERRVSVPLA